MKPYQFFFKPLTDGAVALLGLLLLSPVFLILVLLLSIANNGKPFFFQARPGRNGRIFRVIKFKTMNDRCDAGGILLPDHERLTAVGSFVRKTSLDEIPQLINVLKGDMSLIGPRPLLVDYLSLYSPQQARRHEVKPGITGWAQVNGRNAISWEQKFELDVWYVDHISLLLDIRILIMTVIKVFKSEGIAQAGHVTTEKFTGTVSV
ncbi:sugar transferase [Chitinophaga sp. Mgbs1]|uniref:Sugar transferase n=1 Tax=Chitinophaga solisilvae TaxID=1233460 RepID=A0A3S1AZQ2_9BACT|nr:sugar transferase [Chitinophaga solisilvae]